MSKPEKDDDWGKDDDSCDWMGGLVRSTIQKVQRVHQLVCSYASFMLLLHYYLCLFYTNYASTKKQCYIVSCSSVYFFTPSKKWDNSSNRMGGSVRSTFQEVQRIHELEFLNVSFMLSLHFFILDYAVFTRIMLRYSSNII